MSKPDLSLYTKVEQEQRTKYYLPTDGITKNAYYGTQERLEKIGFIIGGGNETFIKVTLPEGWGIYLLREMRQQHTLIDPYGSLRATAYIKLSYQRDQKDEGSLRFVKRFTITEWFGTDFTKPHQYEGDTRSLVVCDGCLDDPGVIKVYGPASCDRTFETLRALLTLQGMWHTQATNWLDMYYPFWNDPFVYWPAHQ